MIKRAEEDIRSWNEETGSGHIEPNKRVMKNRVEQIGGADNGTLDLRQTILHY